MNKTSYWSEIRNNFFETQIRENEGDALAFICIDAWHTPDGNEEGEVIAKVALSKHGDVIVSYHNNVAREDAAAQDAIRDAIHQLKDYYHEQVQEAPLWDQSTAFLLPDDSRISILLKKGSVMRDEADKREWCSVDIVRERAGKTTDILCSVDYEDGLGLRTLAFAPDKDEPVFTQHTKLGEPAQHSFYYTFGTSISFPFQRGWVEVMAKDLHEANQLFRTHFPDKTPGVLNCAFVYEEAAFEKIRQDYESFPDWNLCHQVITRDNLPQRATTLSEQIRSAELRSSGDSQASVRPKSPER